MSNYDSLARWYFADYVHQGHLAPEQCEAFMEAFDRIARWCEQSAEVVAVEAFNAVRCGDPKELEYPWAEGYPHVGQTVQHAGLCWLVGHKESNHRTRMMGGARESIGDDMRLIGVGHSGSIIRFSTQVRPVTWTAVDEAAAAPEGR